MKPATKIRINTIPPYMKISGPVNAQKNAQTHAMLALHYYSEAEKRYRLDGGAVLRSVYA